MYHERYFDANAMNFPLSMSWNNDRAREQQERLLEAQTDGLASSLSDKVSRIKQVLGIDTDYQPDASIHRRRACVLLDSLGS
jgi:hypothetical protein